MVDWLEPAPALYGLVWVLGMDSGVEPAPGAMEINPEDTSVRCAVFPLGVSGAATLASSAAADKGAASGTESAAER